LSHTEVVTTPIIGQHQSRWEKLKLRVSGFSPQVKAALIGFGALLAGCLLTFFLQFLGFAAANRRLTQELGKANSKIQDLQFELTPVRTAAIQRYGRADAETIKMLADYLTNVDAILKAANREIDTLKSPDYQAATAANLTITETIRAKDTNRAALLQTTDKTNRTTRILVCLSHTPIAGSVQTVCQNWATGAQTSLSSPGGINNVILYNFAGSLSTSDSVNMADLIFNVSYLRDLRQTNHFSKVEVRGDQVYLDGRHLPIP
jgi:hypothetical protein